MLADGGRFVIRYDHRDTGRSVTYEPGPPRLHGRRPGRRRRRRARRLRDRGRARGRRLGGRGASRSCSRSTSPIASSRSSSSAPRPRCPATAELPPPTEEFGRFVATAEVDWSDARLGDRVPGRLLARARRRRSARSTRRASASSSAATSSARATSPPRRTTTSSPTSERPREPLSSIAAPTLVIHGTADPMFPLEHGEALAEEIPGARLLPLEGAGHGRRPSRLGRRSSTRSSSTRASRAEGRHSVTVPPGGGARAGGFGCAGCCRVAVHALAGLVAGAAGWPAHGAGGFVAGAGAGRVAACARAAGWVAPVLRRRTRSPVDQGDLPNVWRGAAAARDVVGACGHVRARLGRRARWAVLRGGLPVPGHARPRRRRVLQVAAWPRAAAARPRPG